MRYIYLQYSFKKQNLTPQGLLYSEAVEHYAGWGIWSLFRIEQILTLHVQWSVMHLFREGDYQNRGWYCLTHGHFDVHSKEKGYIG